MTREFYIGDTIMIGAVNEAARRSTPEQIWNLLYAQEPNFLKAGFTPHNLAYAFAQMLHESDYMTSNVADVDNNYSGIKWINKPYQKNATRGLPAEGGGNYAHFDTFQDWINDFYRILNIKGPKGRPLDATDYGDYVDRLMSNHYMTDPHYIKPYTKAVKLVTEAIKFGAAQDQKFIQAYDSGQRTFTVDAKKGWVDNAGFDADREKTKLLQQIEGLPTWEKIAGGVLLIILAGKIVSR